MFQMLNEEIFRKIFHLFCATAAISLSIFWIYTYSLNEDLCKVEFKSYYEDTEDKLPVLSICFKDFLSDEKLKLIPHQVTRSKYLEFLKGDLFEENLANVVYQNVTVNMDEYIKSQLIIYRNESYIDRNFNSSNENKIIVASSVALWRDVGLYTCYTLQMAPNNEVELYQIGLKKTVFPNGSRGTVGGMITILHYPNQLLVSTENLRYSWPTRKTNDKFRMMFKINGVEVIKRRNRRRKPCHENWKNYDDFVLLDHLNKVGCRVPYLHTSQSFPWCNSSKTIKAAQLSLKRSFSDKSPPCKSMEKLYYTYEEEEYGSFIDAEDGVFQVGVWFSSQQFKEITQTRYPF